jgi:hypothetical protein
MGSRELGSETLVISSLRDVERLRSSPARLWKLHGLIELRIPDLVQPERERLESRLNELAGVCGCAEGSVAGAIALIAIVVFWIQREIAFSCQSVFTAGVTVIGASLLAKLVRVITARIRLRQVLGDLLRTSPRNIQRHQGGAMP